jgi:hypothetical protein
MGHPSSLIITLQQAKINFTLHVVHKICVCTVGGELLFCKRTEEICFLTKFMFAYFETNFSFSEKKLCFYV